MTDIKESISQETINTVNELSEYKHGWTTDIDTDKIPKGLSEDTIRLISAKKNEPEWMLEWRLNAYKVMQTMKEPDWAKVDLPKIDYQDLYYYSAPKGFEDKPKSLDELDPKLLETYKKLGIPLDEQKRLNGIAVDAVFDSCLLYTSPSPRDQRGSRMPSSA